MHSWQEYHYENADSANAGYAAVASELREFQRSVPTAAEVADKKNRWHGKAFSDVASTCGGDGDSDDEAQDFFSFSTAKRSLAASASSAGSRRSGSLDSLKADGHKDLSPRQPAPKRLRDSCEDEWPADAASELAEERAEEDLPDGKSRGKTRGKSDKRALASEEGKPAAKVAKASKSQKLIDKAQGIYEAKAEALSPMQLWQTKHKQRTIDLGCKALEDQASKIMQCTEEDAVELVDRIARLSDKVKSTHALFNRMRGSLEWLKGTWEEGDKQLLLGLSPPVIAGIIISFAKDLLKDWLKETAAVIVSIS